MGRVRTYYLNQSLNFYSEKGRTTTTQVSHNPILTAETIYISKLRGESDTDPAQRKGENGESPNQGAFSNKIYTIISPERKNQEIMQYSLPVASVLGALCESAIDTAYRRVVNTSRP